MTWVFLTIRREPRTYFAALLAEEPSIEPLQIFTMDVSQNTAMLESIVADLMNANVPVEVTVGEDWNEFGDLLEEDGDTPYNLLLTEYCISYDDAQTLWDAWFDGSFTTSSDNWQSEAFLKLMDASLERKQNGKARGEICRLWKLSQSSTTWW